MPSEKTVVIEYIWNQLQQEGTGRRVVYAPDVVAAIEHCNTHHSTGLSTGNPANFLKDVVRSDNASGFWPDSLLQQRIGARQRPGNKRVFEFVDFAPNQTEPFPNTYMPNDMEPFPVQSISLSRAAKGLGRKDESWLIQVAVKLSVLESPSGKELSHLNRM